MSVDPAGLCFGANGPSAPPSANPVAATSATTARRLRPDLAGRCSVGLFDLDGVMTDTARIHAEAWRQMFDEFLRGHAAVPASSSGPLTSCGITRRASTVNLATTEFATSWPRVVSIFHEGCASAGTWTDSGRRRPPSRRTQAPPR